VGLGVDTLGPAAPDLGEDELVHRLPGPHGAPVAVEPDVDVDAPQRGPLHVPQGGLQSLADLVGEAPQPLAEQAPHDDPTDRRSQLGMGDELPPRHPRVEGTIHLGGDQPEVGVDPLDRERRLHEPTPAAVLVAVGQQQRVRPVHHLEQGEGLAPGEVRGVRGEDELVGLGAEQVGEPDRDAVPDVDHGPVPVVQPLERPGDVADPGRQHQVLGEPGARRRGAGHGARRTTIPRRLSRPPAGRRPP